MKLDKLVTMLCDSIPVPREPGVLYVSQKYDCAIHLCPCGCGNEVVTPLESDALPGWKLTLVLAVDGGAEVTLSPSILCRTECGSHYFIRSNRVEWCG
jgi:hypothetical protein